MREFGLFVDGAWRPASGGATYESVNPATGEVWALAAAASVEDVNEAVEVASRAHRQGVWRGMSGQARGEILNRVADLLIDRQDAFVLAEVADSGGTFRKGNIADIPAAMQTFQYYGGLAESVAQEVEEDEFVPVPSRNIVRTEPLGVVAAIIPFNFPLAAAAWKVAPILAAGNTLVLKPSPLTPATALMLAEICHEAGVPDGVFNVVTGPGADVGAALVGHRKVAKVAFTGSSKVGQIVMRSCAETIKPVMLELGGKSANIILEDADLEIAVRGALFGTFFHSGQICVSGTRVLVPRSRHDEFVEMLVESAKLIRVGDPMDPMTTMGPVINDSQLRNVERYVGMGLSEGARCVFGGGRTEGMERGYFHDPTIFVGVDNSMSIAAQEIFGPVVSIIPFDDEAQAIEIANDSMYGLAGAVWSKDIERATQMARELETGTVWINDYHLLNVRFPFGGYKSSGFGRELGPQGLAEYQQVKHIHVGESSSVDEKYYFGMLLD
jgi:aldehyde dehydrogenase (NAD+)